MLAHPPEGGPSGLAQPPEGQRQTCRCRVLRPRRLLQPHRLEQGGRAALRPGLGQDARPAGGDSGGHGGRESHRFRPWSQAEGLHGGFHEGLRLLALGRPQRRSWRHLGALEGGQAHGGEDHRLFFGSQGGGHQRLPFGYGPSNRQPSGNCSPGFKRYRLPAGSSTTMGSGKDWSLAGGPPDLPVRRSRWSCPADLLAVLRTSSIWWPSSSRNRAKAGRKVAGSSVTRKSIFFRRSYSRSLIWAPDRARRIWSATSAVARRNWISSGDADPNHSRSAPARPPGPYRPFRAWPSCVFQARVNPAENPLPTNSGRKSFATRSAWRSAPISISYLTRSAP